MKFGKKRRISESEITFDEITVDGRTSLGYKERPLGENAFFIAAFLIILLPVIAVVRVGYFIFIKGGDLSARASSSVNSVVTVIAPRGIIVDRYGKPLVENTPSLTAYARAGDVVRYGEKEKVLEAASLLGIDKSGLDEILSKTDLSRGDTISIKKDISATEAIAIETLGLKSVFVGSDLKRSVSPQFAHVVGYVGAPKKEDMQKGILPIDVVGKTHLEALFDTILRGKNGAVISYRDAKGKFFEEQKVSDPVIGGELKTTIDADLQKYFYERLAENLVNAGPGGVGIAIDPKNGEVLALVSEPSFSSAEILKGLIDPKKPLFNRAISGLYPPASTIKTIVATAALNEKVIDPDEEILSTGKLSIPNKYDPDHPTIFVDWKAHGWVDVYAALARSSNIYFYGVGGGLPYNPDLFMGVSDISKGVGAARLKDYYTKFGLAEKTGIELTGEVAGRIPSPDENGLKPDGSRWTIGDTYHISIGQGDMGVTPLALISAVSSIANGGYVFEPHLILGKEPKIRKDNSSMKKALDEVVLGMRHGVMKSYGTSNMLNTLPFDTIGKTGSAQVMNNQKTNAFFVGCGPTPVMESERSICILILIENAKEGGLNAVPVAYDVFKWYYENRLK